MTFLSLLKAYPEAIAVPLCRYFEITDKILEGLTLRIRGDIEKFKASDDPVFEEVSTVLADRLRIMTDVRKCVKGTKPQKAYWQKKGSEFSLENQKEGDGVLILRRFVMHARKWKEAHPEEEEQVVRYALVLSMALQCFGRDALFELHLPEIDQRHFTYLSLIVDRLSIALRDLEDERIVGRYHYPEDDSPLDVGQYGFSLHPYDEGMTLAVKRLTPGQRAILAMILRQYCHAFNERFPDVTLFQYALRQFPSEGLREISMQAVPVLMQLADDIGEDIPVNKELDMLRQAGFVDPVLDTRSQCILRYGTSNDWPLAAYLRLVNLHLRNILDVEHRLPATEFLDFIFNDSLSEEIIRRNLSMDTGLEITLAASLRCFRRQVPRSLARAFCMSSALTLPLLKDILNSPDKSLDEILSGTPLASCNQQSVDQFMAGAASYVSGYREDFPREIVDLSDRASMFAVVKEEIPRLREDITLAVKGLTEHESRELFRGVILYWSVALTLLRRHAETVTNDVDRNGYELLCNFIAVGTGDLIERFNLIDWQEKAEESIEEEPADKTMLN